MICSVKGCVRAVKATGLCGTHYQRNRRTGSTFSHRPISYSECQVTLIRLFQTETDECLPWPHGLTSSGYPQLSDGGHNILGHRRMCEIANGPVPFPSAQSAHSCGSRRCMNKRHLRWATPAENTADQLLHGTRLRGEKVPGAKLTNIQAREVYNADGTQRDIADRYGVTQKVVSNIKNGRAYLPALGMN